MFIPDGSTTVTCSLCGLFSCFGHFLSLFFFDYRVECLQPVLVVSLLNTFGQMESPLNKDLLTVSEVCCSFFKKEKWNKEFCRECSCLAFGTYSHILLCVCVCESVVLLVPVSRFWFPRIHITLKYSKPVFLKCIFHLQHLYWMSLSSWIIALLLCFSLVSVSL